MSDRKRGEVLSAPAGEVYSLTKGHAMGDPELQSGSKILLEQGSMQRISSPIFLAVFLILALALFSSSPVKATEAYAEQTGRICAACHLDPAGGGELTAAGEIFAAAPYPKAERASISLFARGFRLLVGYLHFLTGVFWFGTILYVHLVLKPAYAASGLPRGEMRVGIVSMAVMGITGAILSYYRINTLDTLLHSRFGVLLLIKVSLYLIMVLSAVIVITVIGPRLRAKRREQPVAAGGDLMLEELAACDGKAGHPAYVAYAGKIYDVTPSRFWKQGSHMGRHNAGGDLTEALKQAPHGQEKVAAMREVGVLIAGGPRKKALPERVFYFMAYMNLAFVLVVILILALWRWG